jgi:serine/threonine-protein kinase RsbW
MDRRSRRATNAPLVAGGPQVKRFRMRSRREAVAPAVERILAAVEAAGFDREQRQDLSVALSEALSNAAFHGNGLRHRSQVRITVTLTPREGASVEVEDSGNGFDPGSVEDPTDPARVLAPRGRGIFLMRSLVDEVEFSPPGNRVRLTMRTRR